jgi:energy-coupling factor transporter transmembrane protein EcfT
LEKNLKFHPAAQIVAWCLLVAAAQAFSLGPLLAAAGLVFLAALAIAARKFAQLIRRTRWIMLSLLLVYAYSTSGEPLISSLGTFAPSRDGLLEGLLQLTRLLVALAGLAILLDRLNRQDFISGLFLLLAPLRLLGIPRERVAVRLALTLHYADQAMAGRPRGWQESLHSLFEPQEEDNNTIAVTLHRFRLIDWLLLVPAFWLAFEAFR